MNDAMYLDLECILEKMELLNILIMKTFHLQIKKDMHTVCGYSLTHLSNETKECNTIASHGKDSLENIGKSLVNYSKKMLKTKKTRKCPKLNKEQKELHESTNQCHICEKKFITDKIYHKLKKVIDHVHYTGKYRGATHSICSLRYSKSNDIFVGIHNGSNYDFKLLLKKIASYFKQHISVIAESIEKYMTFCFTTAETQIYTGKEDQNDKPIIKTIKHKIRFVDTNRLLTRSLDTCVNNLSTLFECDCKNKSNQQIKLSHNDTNIISKCKSCLKRTNHDIHLIKDKFNCISKLANNSIDNFKLLLRKGLYPYEYMDSFDKFKETPLSSKESFNSAFRNTKISDNDYKHAQKVWKTFKC